MANSKQTLTIKTTHVDIWQNQYNIVKLKNEIKLKKEQNTAKMHHNNSIYITERKKERKKETKLKYSKLCDVILVYQKL